MFIVAIKRNVIYKEAAKVYKKIKIYWGLCGFGQIRKKAATMIQATYRGYEVGRKFDVGKCTD